MALAGPSRHIGHELCISAVSDVRRAATLTTLLTTRLRSPHCCVHFYYDDSGHTSSRYRYSQHSEEHRPLLAAPLAASGRCARLRLSMSSAPSATLPVHIVSSERVFPADRGVFLATTHSHTAVHRGTTNRTALVAREWCGCMSRKLVSVVAAMHSFRPCGAHCRSHCRPSHGGAARCTDVHGRARPNRLGLLS